MNFYISDLHLSHGGMAFLRGFKDVESMNDVIVDSINSVCRKRDTLYVLGDVADGYNCPNVVPWLKKIKPRMVLVVGNHDGSERSGELSFRQFRECFSSIKEHARVRDGIYCIYLSHYPHAEWDGMFKGWWHFYGHVHNADYGGAAIENIVPTAVNVGWDVLGKPMTAENLVQNRIETYYESLPDISVKDFVKAAIFDVKNLPYYKGRRFADFSVFEKEVV